MTSCGVVDCKRMQWHVEETALVLKVSPVTVGRDCSGATIWLYRELTGDTDDGRESLETAR